MIFFLLLLKTTLLCFISNIVCMIKEFCLRHCHIFVMSTRENNSEFLNFMQSFADSLLVILNQVLNFSCTKKNIPMTQNRLWCFFENNLSTAYLVEF